MFITQLFLHQVREALRARKARRRKQTDQKAGAKPASNPTTLIAEKDRPINKFVFSGKEESIRKKKIYIYKERQREKIRRKIIIKKNSWIILFFINQCILTCIIFSMAAVSIKHTKQKQESEFRPLWQLPFKKVSLKHA